MSLVSHDDCRSTPCRVAGSGCLAAKGRRGAATRLWPRQARAAAGTRRASWRGAAGRGRGDADNDKLHDFTLDEASYEGAHERLVRRQRRRGAQCSVAHTKCHFQMSSFKSE